MTDHQPLFDRLEALLDRSKFLDWDDVVRRAGEPGKAARPARARRSYLARRVVPVLVLAVAGLAVGLIASWGNGPSIVDRALAAIGDGPVIHAVLSGETGKTYIDLATGRETPQIQTTEIWYDRERHLEHWRSRIDGRIFIDSLQTPTGITTSHSPPLAQHGYPKLDPALAGFVDGYRSALKRGSARKVGAGTVNGHDVTWIEFTLFSSSRWKETERVAVDNGNALPLQIERFANGKSEGSSAVALIESLSEGSGNFAAPKAGPPSNGVKRDRGNPVSPAGAVKALPNALWAGDSVAGLSISSMWRETLTKEFLPASGLQPQISNGIEIHYGNGWAYPGAKVIPEGTTPDGTFAWLEETTAADSIYSIEIGPAVVPPPAGSLLLADCLTGSKTQSLFGRGCHGLVFEKGVFVYVRASSRDLLIAAARALEPIQASVGTN